MTPRSTKSRIVNFPCIVLCACAFFAQAQEPGARIVAGTVLNARGEVVAGAAVTARWRGGNSTAITSGQGAFSFNLPAVPLTLTVTGRYIGPNSLRVAADASANVLRLQIDYVIPREQQTLVITARAADPAIDRRNDTIYKNTLFLRDDQLVETLDSGINAGQHEGGGKSLEFRRFGFNLDHGGLNGGLKVLVDDIPQNQATQAHGQGYLGWLKALSPELVEDVDLINGPFSAEYGDFSALGVIHIRLKEELDDALTLRASGGSFDGYRTFAAWSPRLKSGVAFLAWEHAFTNGPFLNPLHYARDSVTGNYTRQSGSSKSLGFRFNAGRNEFNSSGQIPLDLVYAGVVNRVGYMDPSDGGRVCNASVSSYFKRDYGSNGTLRVDGYLTRSLFDLFSNFTFYLSDPVNGDGIQQHDSRLAGGGSAQYLHTTRLFGLPSLLNAGLNLTDNWINVDLFHDKDRHIIPPVPGKPWTEANVHILNPAVYLQEGIDTPRLHVEGGLRFDEFRFALTDRLVAANGGIRSASAPEPKLNLVFLPALRLPMALHFNYGRTVTSQDARGMALDPAAPKAATTSFYMLGASNELRRLSFSTDVFLIDRQHEDVYDPDNGTMQYQGPSRSSGWEAKTSFQFSSHLSWNAGLTQVTNAFFLGTSPRQYVDSAPHSVGNSGLTLDGWHALYASLRYRHISRYLVVNPDKTSVAPAPPYTSPFSTRASGLDVLDFALAKRLFRGLDWDLAVDNLNDKRYYETQNFFDSRVAPGAPIEARVHGTPGYPIGFTTGLTWRWE